MHALAIVCLAGLTATASAQVQVRSFASRAYLLELDGEKAGLIQSVEGGNVSAEVIEEPVSADYFVKKHIGYVKYNEFILAAGFDPPAPIRGWIEASLSMNYMRKSGELKAADFKRDGRTIREFKDALITGITFPAGDGAGKEPAFLSIKFSPEYVRYKQGDGSKVENPVDMNQKSWHPSDYRLTIDGLDCSKVTKIESLTVDLRNVLQPVGEQRNIQGKPQAKVSHLVFYVPADAAAPFQDWHQDFVINGNNQQEQEKSGSISYLDRNRKKALLTLTLRNIGIFNLSEVPDANNEDKPKQFKIECYVERLEMKLAD